MPKCTVLSIGSRGDINFERSLLQHTNCTVDIFDCTVLRCDSKRRGAWPPEMRTGRVRYHQVCIGAEDRIEASKQIRADWKQGSGGHRFVFRSYESIIKRLKLEDVTAMKMDIEVRG